MRTGAVLLGLVVLSLPGIERQADFGVAEVARDSSAEWCLTYEYPDGATLTECRPTEDEVWAWAGDLDAELGNEERLTTAGKAFSVLFCVSLVGAIGSFAWGGYQHRRSGRAESRPLVEACP